jgi:hypothetical protein
MSGLDSKVVDTARRLGAARGLKMACVLTKPTRVANLREILRDVMRAFGTRAI